MKKLLFGAAALLLLAGCSGNGNNETTDEATQDSTAVTVADDSVKATPDAPEAVTAKDASQYDDLLKQYENAVTAYQKFIKNFKGNYSKQPSYTKKCNNLYSKLNKAKNSLTEEQKKKLKSLKSKYDQAYYRING